MPGFVTHYLFGREAYHTLESGAQKNILCENRAAFGLGLQGPDIFFYYLPSYVLHRRAIGSLAHTQETNAFFLGLLLSYERMSRPADRAIAEAYLTGFLGHYLLDTTCHPFVYARTHYTGRKKDYFSRHAYLETDIDSSLLDLKLHLRPSEFQANSTIALTRRQKQVIATMLYHAFRYAYPWMHLPKSTMYMAVFSIRLGMRLLHDPTGQKKVLFRFAEKVFLGYPVFSPLIPSDTLFFRTDPFNMRHAPWKNPWDDTHTSTESFFDLYEKALGRYLPQMKALHTLLHTEEKALRDTRLRAFLKTYDNLSFHSGLDASIPS